MKKRILAIALLMFSLKIFFLPYGLAQDVKPPTPTLDIRVTTRAWQESIDALKKSAESILEQNEKLQVESDSLKNQLIDLEEMMKKIEEDNQRLIHEPDRLNKFIRETEANNKLLEREIINLEKQKTILEKNNISLQEELSQLEKRQKPWENQIATLKDRETHLNLDLKLMKSSPLHQEIEALKGDLEELRQSITATEGNKLELQGVIKKGLEEYTSIFKDIQRLKKENQKLSSEILKTRQMLGVYTKQIEAFKKEEIGKDSYNRLLDERAELALKKEYLENQINEIQELSKSLGESTQETPRSENLMNLLSDLMTENRSLENKVIDLREAIDALKRENAMIEALLAVQKERNTHIAYHREGDIYDIDLEGQDIAEAMAYALASQGKYQEAIEKYKEALAQGGNKRDIYFNLGYLYYQLNNIPEAIKSYKRVLKIDPRDEEARSNIFRLRKELSQQKK